MLMTIERKKEHLEYIQSLDRPFKMLLDHGSQRSTTQRICRIVEFSTYKNLPAVVVRNSCNNELFHIPIKYFFWANYDRTFVHFNFWQID